MVTRLRTTNCKRSSITCDLDEYIHSSTRRLLNPIFLWSKTAAAYFDIKEHAMTDRQMASYPMDDVVHIKTTSATGQPEFSTAC